jgi:hypothetical protein
VFGELRKAGDADSREGSGSDEGQFVRQGHACAPFASSAHTVRLKLGTEFTPARSAVFADASRWRSHSTDAALLAVHVVD